MKNIQFLLLSIFLCTVSESFGYDGRETVDCKIGLSFMIETGKDPMRNVLSYEIKIPLDVSMVYAIAAEIDRVLARNDYPEFHRITVRKLCTGIPCIPYEYTICIDIERSSINLAQAKAAIAKVVENELGAKVRW